MTADRGHKPALPAGRGLLLVDDWCAATGLDRAVAETLLRTGAAEGVFRGADMQPMWFYDDVLPQREQLEEMGLTVNPEYDPDEMRSHSVTDDDDLAQADDVEDDAEGPEGAFTVWSFTLKSDPA